MSSKPPKRGKKLQKEFDKFRRDTPGALSDKDIEIFKKKIGERGLKKKLPGAISDKDMKMHKKQMLQKEKKKKIMKKRKG